MKEYSLEELKQKYLKYKEILEGIENGDFKTFGSYTVEQIENMIDIVKTLDDYGFHLMVRIQN